MVARGPTNGLDEVDEKPAGLLAHEYVLPATAVAPIEIDGPAHIVAFGAVAAAGVGTVMVTELDFTHPLEFVSVTV